MHWLDRNDAVPWLNKAKTQILLLPILKNLKFINLYFICQPTSQPAISPVVRTRCKAPEISHNKGNGGGFTPTVSLAQGT